MQFNYEAIGQRLRQAREELGLTQGRFAEGLGVKTSIISEMERGNAKPTMTFLLALEYVYGFRKEWISTGEGLIKRTEEDLRTSAYTVGININKQFRLWVDVLIHIFKSGDKNKIEAIKAQLRALGPVFITTGFTRADIFKQSAFAIGEKLPDDPGQLDGILVLEVDATPNMKSEALLCRLIECFDQMPFRKLEQRSRQLTGLLIESFKDNDYISIIIHNAHYLTEDTIRKLTRLHEIHGDFGPSPQIVLLGDIIELNKKIDSIESIKQRAMIF